MEESKTINVTIAGEDLLMTQDEYDHLMSLGIDFSDENWENVLLESKQYDLLVNALFTMSKVDKAWEIIEKFKEEIDYEKIFNLSPDSQCPYFQLKRDAKDVYKYMHDQGIIDDISYEYFQVLGGSISDIDFWTNIFEGMSTSEKLCAIHEAFNNVNPFDVGVVNLTKESEELIFGNLQDGEYLDDFIIGKNPGVFFDWKMIMNLIDTNHLKEENFPIYMDILFEMSNAINNQIDGDLWSYALKKCGEDIDRIPLNTVLRLDSFIESDVFKTLVEEGVNYTINKMLLNSLAFMNYPYRYRDMLAKRNYDINCVNVSDYLEDKNYPYVLSYKLLSFVNTDDFIVKYPFPAVFNCIYNSSKGKIFANGKIIYINDPDEEALFNETFAFTYEYENGNIDEGIMDKCSSDEEYREVVYSTNEFISAVRSKKEGVGI